MGKILERILATAWLEERRALVGVSAGTSLRSVIRGGKRSWCAVASFCETVLLRKEAAERDRERSGDPARRRATWARPRQGASPLTLRLGPLPIIREGTRVVWRMRGGVWRRAVVV